MAGHEQVVIAFLRIWVAHQAALGSHRAELRVTARDELVRINLVARVPNQPVVLEVECLMQRQAKLDDAQVRREVRTAAAHEIAQHFAHLVGQLLELRQRQFAQVLRRFNRGQKLLFSHT